MSQNTITDLYEVFFRTLNLNLIRNKTKKKASLNNFVSTRVDLKFSSYLIVKGLSDIDIQLVCKQERNEMPQNNMFVIMERLTFEKHVLEIIAIKNDMESYVSGITNRFNDFERPSFFD